MSYGQIILSLHASLFIYGISMGSFAFLGREYVERSSGKINFLISSPLLLPIKFRKTFVAFYLHDVIFYYIMVIIPITAGLILSVPAMGYSLISILFLSITLFICFVIGLAFCFFMSAIYIKNIPAFSVMIVALAVLMAGSILTSRDIGWFIPGMNIYLDKSIFHLGLALFYIIFFSVSAALFIEERFESVRPKYQNHLPRMTKRFRYFRGNSHLFAKEYLDLLRSRAITKIAFSFVIPLLIITFMSWLLNSHIVMEVEFNTVFYASMVGFFSVMIYYWLTTMDNLESFQVLPLDVPSIIKIKLALFIIISSIVSTIYIVIISGINDEFHLLGISLFIMFTTSFYIATSTAYLTGLRTHSYLFDISILIRFGILSALPLICLQIIVLNLNTYWFVAITALLITTIIMIIATIILYKGIDRKWARAAF
ncbi:MAG: hypothetical protein JSV49_05510 [Thermoplasmata archaeon]|nr:MAG: hypothetical protein JSV49_05510 [Thermoplasmata archaeon]